jgi:fibronectin type 3 domain-containing protein
MKNFFRWLGIIALVVTIGFGFTACDDGSTGNNGGGGGNTLAAPTGLSATATSSSEISVSWSPVGGASGYNVYNSLSSSSGFELLITEQTTGITNFNLPANTTIYYKVAAFSANGTEGALSNVFSATTKDVENNPFIGTWSGIGIAVGFSITFNTNTNWVYFYQGESGSGTYTYTGLTAILIDEGDPVTAVIVGNILTLILPDGDSLTFNRGGTGTAPATPAGLITTGATVSSISLSWSSVTGATGYRVYRSSSETGTYTQVGTTSLTSYTDKSLNANTLYYYKVSAYNSNGESPRSSSVFAITLSDTAASIIISGTPRVGQKLTATCTGTGWRENTINWAWCDTADGTFEQVGTGSTFIVPSNLNKRYIRALRGHPDGPWHSHSTGLPFHVSNFLGPVQQ